MKLSIISFTEKGRQLSVRIAELLDGDKAAEELCRGAQAGMGMETGLFTKCGAFANDREDAPVSYVSCSVTEWAKEQMEARNAMLFIGACGIAVRAIAPSLTDKLHDAPVLVMDEKGKYVIPVLSGHMGGANELAEYLARRTGAEPVITTATDLNGKFAVDLFARRNGFFIVNKDGIAKVSAKVLAEQEIVAAVETGHRKSEAERDSGIDHLPAGTKFISYPPTQPVDIVITSEDRVFAAAIRLKPREYVIGMGCRRGKPAEELEAFISRKLEELRISKTQIYALASISQKRGEAAMVQWCRREGIPFLTYTAEELQEVEGTFSQSDFVKAQVGVDNVCERAALKACGDGGKLMAGKCAGNGMTIAVARRSWKL